MYDKIIFHNCAHKGDLFVSKEFVKHVINNVDAKYYLYYHKWSKKLLSDIDKLQFVDYDNNIYKNNWLVDQNNIYINTWYRACNDLYHNGTTIQTLYNMFKNEGAKLNIKFSDDITDYIPKIDYDKFNILNAKKFIDKHTDKKMIIICNNMSLSGQSINYNWDSHIEILSDKFQHILFLVTNRFGKITKQNVIYTSDILQCDDDLNENAFLASHCKMIIGRGSGPYTYCLNKDILDKNIKMISFSCIDSTSFGLHNIYQDKFISINKYDGLQISNILSEHIKCI